MENWNPEVEMYDLQDLSAEVAIAIKEYYDIALD